MDHTNGLVTLVISTSCLILVLHNASTVVDGVLVSKPTPQLVYHGGPILSSQPTLHVYILWYGEFSTQQTQIVVDLLTSIQSSTAPPPLSVGYWWAIMSAYKDSNGTPVSPSVQVSGQISDLKYSHGTTLTHVDVEALVISAIAQFTADPFSIYIVITSADVVVQDFCESECATHAVVTLPSKTAVPYMWVGNSATQCPGQCAWPFAQPKYMDYYTSETTKKPPNGDIGMDGIVINIATILAGAAANPDGNGYYEGDPEVPLEVGTVCTGIFGSGAYPGEPGKLLTDNQTQASYNAVGVNQRKFLLPALWDPNIKSCRTLT